MPKRSGVPSYRRHFSSGQGTCRFPQPFKGRRDHYFGLFELPESRARYDQLVAEWLMAGRAPTPAITPQGDLSVRALVAMYVAANESRYVKAGRQTGHLARIELALSPLEELSDPAATFTPQNLKAARAWMAQAPCVRCSGDTCKRCGGSGRRGWTRGFINCCTSIIKAMFDWAGEEGHIPAEVGHRLRQVKGLRGRQPGIRDTKPVQAVRIEHVRKTLAELSPTVADMVRLQHLAGMRPCEVIGMRPENIRYNGEVDGARLRGVWVYEVAAEFNKNYDDGIARVITLGPKAMRIIKPYLKRRRPDEFLFSPREAAEWYYRKKGQRINHSRARMPGGRYSTRSYEQAIEAAARRAGVPHWAPNQLRHTRATEIRSKFQPDAARVVLGHALPGVTGRYVHADYEVAAEVMRKVG